MPDLTVSESEPAGAVFRRAGKPVCGSKREKTIKKGFRGKNLVTLAVPEKIFGLTLILDFFDRGAKPCSLVPPPAALAGFAPGTFLYGSTTSLLVRKETGWNKKSIVKSKKNIVSQ